MDSLRPKSGRPLSWTNYRILFQETLPEARAWYAKEAQEFNLVICVRLPETMKIRSQFLTETGPVYQITKSAMDDSYIDDIDYHGENILVIIEGLTMYLCEKDIRKMFSIVEKSFQKVTVMVETMSPFVVKHMKEKSIEGSNAKFTWGVKNGKELQRIIPAFSVRQEISLVEGMKELMPIYHMIGKISIVQNISNKIIVLEKRR